MLTNYNYWIGLFVCNKNRGVKIKLLGSVSHFNEIQQ